MRTNICYGLALLLAVPVAASPVQTALTPGLALSHSATVRPGAYALPDPGAGAVRVTGHDITINFHGAVLHGDGKGSGIVISGARNVTVENAVVSGYHWGIVIEKSQGVRLLRCHASHNGDLPPGTVIDESGSTPQDDHGGGIVLRDSTDCFLSADTATHAWDGVDVVRSDRNVIEDGDYSYNNNWGVHFWGASGNTFRRNKAVWCTTGAGTLYQALTGWQTYDAQAVAIEHNSNDNVIAANDLRHGGDGIFIRANEGPATPGGPPVPVKNGSHRNHLRDNDCSFSPNNAIEVDLVDDTEIVGNNCSCSHYGMWLGISRRCVVRRNLCVDDTAHAVEIERGRDDLFEANTFGSTTPRTASLVYLRANGPAVPSGPYTIRDNLFFGAKTAVELTGTPAAFSGNVVRYDGPDGPGRLVQADAASPVTGAEGNDLSLTVPMPPANAHVPRSVTLSDAEPALAPVIPVTGTDLRPPNGAPPVVTVNGLPAQLASSTPRLAFVLPTDLGGHPAASAIAVRVYNGSAWSVPQTLTLHPTGLAPRVTALAPATPTPGGVLTLTGAGLAGAGILLEGKPADMVSTTGTRLAVRLPGKLYAPAGVNLVVTPRGGEPLAPLVVKIDVPTAQGPHIIAATFRPTRLKVGDRLQVTFTLKNNAPFPADPTRPPGGTVYDEGQSYHDRGWTEDHGKLYLRASTDSDGSWPYLWGIGDTPLAPGETRTITGEITMKTPGTQTYRAGLVSGGIAFIDDSLFQTQITVTP